MDKSAKDAGIIAVLLERLNKQRLPRALDLKAKVDRGELLNDFDIGFLEEALADANKVISSMLNDHPEYKDLASRMLHLYSEIMKKALENEENQG